MRLMIKKINIWYYLGLAYFAENWKHYNKIIFKYVNSAVRLIFNFFFHE